MLFCSPRLSGTLNYWEDFGGLDSRSVPSLGVHGIFGGNS